MAYNPEKEPWKCDTCGSKNWTQGPFCTESGKECHQVCGDCKEHITLDVTACPFRKMEDVCEECGRKC